MCFSEKDFEAFILWEPLHLQLYGTKETDTIYSNQKF